MKTTNSESIALVADEAAPAPVASRLDGSAWFIAHLVSVAVMTAAGAVVALFAVLALVLFAPVFLVLFAASLRRHDLVRLRAAAI